jgi:hypothetical protein
VSSGLFYGLGGLAAKGISTLLVHDQWSSSLKDILVSPYPYIFAVAWVLGLATFQSGIQKGRVGVVGPVSGAICAVYVVAVGTPVFGEHLPTSSAALVLRLGGFAGIVLGSMLLAWGDADTAVIVTGAPGNI